MSLFAFETTTEKKYKQAYKQHYDKLYPIYQSKKVEISGESYVLVGQMRMNESELFSDFDILHRHCESADENVGYRIHEFISRLLIAKQMISKIRDPITKLKNKDIQPQLIKEDFKLESEQDVDQLTQSLHIIHGNIESFIQVVDKTLAKKDWDETNIQELAEQWSIFMQTYEARAYTLLKLYDQQTDQEGADEEEIATLLRQEAHMVHELYKMATPLGAEIGSFSIDEWIAHHYKYGRFRLNDEPMKKKYRFERGLYSFVVYLYRFAVWFFIPLILLVLFVDGELTFREAMPLISFGFVAMMIKSQNKSHLTKKINNDLNKYYATNAYEEVAEKNG